MDKQPTVSELFGLKQPAPYKSKQSPDKVSFPGLLVGMELEIENIPHGASHYQENAGNFWTVTEDGSLRPRGEAWEFVSKPAELGVALAELRLFFDKFGFTDKNYTDRCSVHVHTNVLDFTQAQIANLAMVYPVFEPVLFRFTNHYKKKEEQGYCRDTNLYCIPWSSCRMNRNFVETFFNNPGHYQTDRFGRAGGRGTWEKYTALNLLPIGTQGTVEWRHMHGTSDMEKLTIWMNVIGSIMKFSKENDMADIVKTIKVLNDVSTYQQFFTAVLGGVLEYKEEYRQEMAEGVVNAKYSLVNWEANKGKEKPKVTVKKLLEPGWVADVAHFDLEEEADGPAPVQQPPIRNPEFRAAGGWMGAEVARVRMGDPVPLGGLAGEAFMNAAAQVNADQRAEQLRQAQILEEARQRGREFAARQAIERINRRPPPAPGGPGVNPNIRRPVR